MAGIGIFNVVSAISGEEAQVTICHHPPGNPTNVQIITVGESAVPSHIQNHGDTVGSCDATQYYYG